MFKSKRFTVALVSFVLILILSGLTVKLTLDSRKMVVYQDSPNSAGIKQESEDRTINISSLQQSKTLIDEEAKGEVNKPQIVSYEVKRGDTLEAIAGAHGISIGTIIGSNGISKDSILKIGQELRFPTINGIAYRIKDGETLWDLSTTYDVEVADITEANDLGPSQLLKIGQLIIIPGADKVKISVNTVKSGVSKASDSVKLASRGGSTSKGTTQAGRIWPLRGTITSRFGPRWGTTHKGIDIAAPTGTSVRAFMSGKVSFSGWQGGYGYLVIIDHSNGLQSYYGHNSKLMVKDGQSVNKGQLISRVGSTGDSTGPHLHFEIRKNGVAVNPFSYLK